MIQNTTQSLDCSTKEMVKYSLGACTESLIMNSFFGFAMLYYTRALGLPPEYAGWAAFIATIWDAVTDPIMGHISDNTRSRYGKRHPYLLFGGLLMIVSYFFIWYVPEFFTSTTLILFWYLVVMNLLLRTAFTVFVIPYTALGFEICKDYTGRSKVQGIRFALNMSANLLGPAMAHTLFFGGDTETVRAANLPQNYVTMGAVFAVAAAVFWLLMLWHTRKYIQDSRDDQTCSYKVSAFYKNLKEVVLDRYSRFVFLFIFCVILGIVLVSNLQMFVFEDFMLFSGWQKSVAHGGTMVGMGIGCLVGPMLVRRFEKKGAICIGVCGSVISELILATLFLTGFIKPDQTLGGFPIALALFSFFHGGYWFGVGIMQPTALSIMADVSEIHLLEKGVDKKSSYAAMYSLATKISVGIGLLISGYCLKWIGFVAGAEAQTSEVIWRMGALTFMAGPILSLAALGLILKYPVDKLFLEELRKKES